MKLSEEGWTESLPQYLYRCIGMSVYSVYGVDVAQDPDEDITERKALGF